MRKLASTFPLLLLGCHVVFPHAPGAAPPDQRGTERASADGPRDAAPADGGALERRPGSDLSGSDGKLDLDRPGTDHAVDQKTALDHAADQKTALDHAADQKTVLDQGVVCDKSKLGKACSTAADCAPMECRGFVAGQKVCACSCTVDNTQTPLVNEDTCPEASKGVSRCVATAEGGRCVKLCTPKLGSSECPAEVACQPAGADGLPSGKSACIYPKCTNLAGCPSYSTPCSTVVGCSSNESCQAFGPNGTGRCFSQGPCDLASGICAPRALDGGKKIGEPCVRDDECPKNGYCEAEFDPLAHGFKNTNEACAAHSECCSRQCVSGKCVGLCWVHARNGYCTSAGCSYAGSLPAAACSSGVCSRYYPGGRCLSSCALASTTCRGVAGDNLGDYECRDWSQLAIAGGAVTPGPVCEWGDAVPCTALQAAALTCSVLGGSGNSTQMSCRNPFDGKVLSNPFDPGGLCLDSTASGPVL